MNDSNDDRRRPDRESSGSRAGPNENGGRGGSRPQRSGTPGAGGNRRGGGPRGNRGDGAADGSGRSGYQAARGDRRGGSGSGRSGDGDQDRRSSGRDSSRGPGTGRQPDRRASAPAGKDDTDARRAEAVPDPPIDPEVTGEELDDEMLSGLGSLSGGLATRVAQHLVMAGLLLDEEPEQAYEHAQAARRRTARVGVVREVVGVTAYAAGKYAEALSEFRAARRITGSDEYLPMMADCERGLGRPRRALELARDPAVERLGRSERIEMLIVAAGARRDLGEPDAAVVSLQVPELRSASTEEWVARLRYAYADALEAAGRPTDAARWFGRASEADVDELTDAAQRAAALDPSAT